MKLYFRNVNSQGGVYGRKIKYIIEDDRFCIPAALSAFKKLVFKDEVIAIAPGASGVGHTHAIIPLAEKQKTVLIAGTNDIRYYHPTRRYVFCPLPFYEDQVKLIFEYITADLGDKNPRIALSYPDVGSGKVTLKATRAQAKAHDIKLLCETVIPVGAGDCSSQVINLRRLSPDYVIIHGYPPNTIAFLRAARRVRLSTTFLVIQYGAVDETVMISGEAARNMIGINCFGSWNDNSPAVKKLRKVTRKYYPESGRRDRTYVQGWFWAMIAVEGLKNAGRDLSGEAFVEGLERIKNFDTQGICGLITYGPDDHKSIEYHRIYRADVENNSLIPITGWRKPKRF